MPGFPHLLFSLSACFFAFSEKGFVGIIKPEQDITTLKVDKNFFTGGQDVSSVG
jgi:hypothetical protein